MDEENHSRPLAPATTQYRSDADEEPFAVSPYNRSTSSKRRNGKCFVYVLALLVLQFFLLLIFSLIVLRPRAPKMKLEKVTVKTMNHSAQPASLHATLLAEVRIENDNFGRYEFRNRTAAMGFSFHGVGVGERRVEGGRVGARSEKRVNVTVEIWSGELGQNGNFSREVNSGVVELWGYAKLNGRIHLLNVVKRKKAAEMSCSLNLHLRNRTAEVVRCR